MLCRQALKFMNRGENMKKREILLTDQEIYDLLNILVSYKTDRKCDSRNSDMKFKEFSWEEIAKASKLQDVLISHM